MSRLLTSPLGLSHRMLMCMCVCVCVCVCVCLTTHACPCTCVHVCPQSGITPVSFRTRPCVKEGHARSAAGKSFTCPPVSLWISCHSSAPSQMDNWRTLPVGEGGGVRGDVLKHSPAAMLEVSSWCSSRLRV